MQKAKGFAPIIFIIAGLVCILLVIILLTLNTQNTNTGTSKPSAKPSGTIIPGEKPRTSTTGNQKSTAPTPTPVPLTKIFSDDHYTIKVPENWQAKSEFVDTGKTVMFKPPGVADDEAFPRIDVIQLPKSETTTVNTITTDLMQYGFKKSTAEFNGIKAIKLQLSVAGDKFIKGNPQHKDVDKDMYIFEKDNVIYQIDYAYYHDTDAAIVQRTLASIITSIQFK